MLTVSTRNFELSHGKKPRGQGHWAFFFDGEQDIDKVMWYAGTFTEVLKKARAYAVAKKHSHIEVGS